MPERLVDVKKNVGVLHLSCAHGQPLLRPKVFKRRRLEASSREDGAER